MKRVVGRAYPRDQPSSSSPAHAEATASERPPRPRVSRKIWIAKRLAICLSIALILLLSAWIAAPALFSAASPPLHSFEFKIYERPVSDLGRSNASAPRIFTRRGRSMLKYGATHTYEEPLGHLAWILHGPEGCFTASLFYIIMEVGVDRKPFYLDIDTGSSLTWIHCRLKPNLKSAKQGPNGYYEAANSDRIVLCNELLCALADDYHDIGRCDDSAPTYCGYELSYADQLATRGVLIKDNMGLTLHTQQVDVELVFGCGYEQTGCEYEVGHGKKTSLPSDGIIGLSKRPASIPSQLHAKKYIRYLIGHCFLPFHKRSGSHVGIFLLGESDMTTKGIQWAKMIDHDHINIQSAYEGEMHEVKYGNRIVASFKKNVDPERFVTFDSGTSMSWLTLSLYLALHHQVNAEAENIGHEALPNTEEGNLGIGGTRCWKVKPSLRDTPFRHFKDITFGFTPDDSKGCATCVPSLFTKLLKFPKFVMPPSNYLTLQGKEADIICLALFPDPSFTFQTFGAYALKGIVFVIDNELHRIGWRRTEDCL